MYVPSSHGLGDATETAALATICPSGIGQKPCNGTNYPAFLQQAVQSRFLPLPNQTNASTTCSGSSATGAAIGAKASNIASKAGGATASIAVAAGAAAGSVVPIVGTI